jgi:lipoprotein-anchoring transpeptidase ErfK/SrfK
MLNRALTPARLNRVNSIFRKRDMIETRKLLAGLLISGALALSGCATSGSPGFFGPSYGSLTDAGYRLPSIPTAKVPLKYQRQAVSYDTKEKPGTIIIDTGARHLYFVQKNGKAMRYGIGVGKQGFEWSGTARIGLKRTWPSWIPPKEMIKRRPELAKFAGGMDPGLKNPLGARALYLFNKRGDMGYRLHGTPEWWSIGKAMSSGCIRLLNQDIIDLYSRAEVGAKVIVR